MAGVSSPGRPATPADRDRCVATAVDAFRGDPSHLYFFADPDTYSRQAAAFHGFLFDVRVGDGTVFVVDDGAAVCVSEPPGGASMPAERAAELRALAAREIGGSTMDRIERYDAVVHAALPPEEFWYIGVLATRSDRQGRGLGRNLFERVVWEADRTGHPIVLETSTESNRSLYMRWGFSTVDHLHIPDGPPVWVMRWSANAA